MTSSPSLPRFFTTMSRNVIALVGVGVVCAVALASSSAHAAGGSLAMMPLRVSGNLALNQGAILEKTLRDLASSKGGYQVQDAGQTTKLVEASQELGIDCEADQAECAAKLGALANAQFLLVAHATAGLDGGIGVDCRVFDVAAHAQVRRASALLASDPDQWSAGLEAYAGMLFSSAQLGSATLEIDPAGAIVTIDGTVRGTSPLPGPVDGLAGGDHYVVVEKPGFLPYHAHLAAQPGGAAPTTVALAVDPNAVHTVAASNTVPLVAAGVGAGLVVVGAATALIAYAQYGAYLDGTNQLNGIDHTPPTNGTFTPDQIQAAKDANKKATDGAGAWSSWGQPTFIASIIGVSVGAIVGGAGAFLALTGEEPAAATSPATTPAASGTTAAAPRAH